MKRNRFFEKALLVEYGIGIVAVLVAWLFGLRLWEYCSLNPLDLGVGLAATGGALLVYWVFRALPLAALRRITELLRSLYRSEMWSLSLWQLALIALAAGFGEELLFRGLLQQGLCNCFPDKEWAVIVVVSLLFGLAHCITATYVLLAFFISLYLGWLYAWTGNLLVPILVHSLYDFLVLGHLYFECRAFERNEKC